MEPATPSRSAVLAMLMPCTMHSAFSMCFSEWRNRARAVPVRALNVFLQALHLKRCRSSTMPALMRLMQPQCGHALMACSASRISRCQ